MFSLAANNLYTRLKRQNMGYRALILSILTVFVIATFFGFTLYLSLEPTPAEAIFGADAAIIIGWWTARSAIEQIAVSIAIGIGVRFIISQLQRLERSNTVGNFLFYSDALAYNQYIGQELNKIVLKKDQGGVDEELIDAPPAQNLQDIIGTIGGTPVARRDGDYSEQLAYLKNQNPNAGLSQDQERLLTRGAVALLTSHVSCQQPSAKAIRNISLYSAARFGGTNPRQINPRSPTFYQDLAKQGNPYSSPDFQELALRDIAASAEAQAERAISQELLASGQKSVRSEFGTVTRSGSAIADFLSQTMNAANRTAAASLNQGKILSTIITSALNVIQSVLFNDLNGRIVAERSVCGSRGGIEDTSYDESDPLPPIDFENAFITVNGQSVENIQPGESATLNWSIGSAGQSGSANISNIGSVADAGTLVVSPTDPITDYELSVDFDFFDDLGEQDPEDLEDDPGSDTNSVGTEIVGVATVLIDDGSGGGGGGGGGPPVAGCPAGTAFTQAPQYSADVQSAFLEVFDDNPNLANESTGDDAAERQAIQLAIDKLVAQGFDAGTRINCNDIEKRNDGIMIGLPGDGLGVQYDVFRGAQSPTSEPLGNRLNSPPIYLMHRTWQYCGGSNCGSTSLGSASIGISSQGYDPSPAPPGDLSQVNWLGADVSRWNITSSLGNPDISKGQICVDHTKRGQWPVADVGGAPTEANPWIFAAIGGEWYAAAYDQLEPGQLCEGLGSNLPVSTVTEAIGPNTGQTPLSSWKPRKGERVGFMVSAPARDGVRTVSERSNVVFINWPF